MTAYLRNVQHGEHVTRRLERLLETVRRYSGLSTVEYADNWRSHGTRGRRADLNAHALLRSDLDRLWALGLVGREQNPELAVEDGYPPTIWYWFALPIEGHAGGHTVTVRERIAAC